VEAANLGIQIYGGPPPPMQGLYGTIFENVARRLRAQNVLVREDLANRVLGMVHGAKSQFSVAFEQMEVTGRSCGGRVEAVYTPNGFLKRLRLDPSIAALPEQRKRRAIVAACCDGRQKGHEVLQRAEEQVYLHFLLILRAMLRAADDPAADVLRSVPPAESVVAAEWDNLSAEERETRTREAAAAVSRARERLTAAFGPDVFRAAPPPSADHPPAWRRPDPRDNDAFAIARQTPAERDVDRRMDRALGSSVGRGAV
jgi:DNA-binding protein YbaB